jgi:hypothetical protein
MPSPMEPYEGFLLVVSNLLLLLPAMEAAKFNLWAEAFLFALTALISMLYHFCFSTDRCIIEAKTLAFTDLLFASAFVQVITVCFVSFLHVNEPWMNSIFVWIGFIINALFLAVNGDVTLPQYIANAVLAVSIVVFSIYRASRSQQRLDSMLAMARIREDFRMEEDLLKNHTSSGAGRLRSCFRKMNKKTFILGLIIGLLGLFLFLFQGTSGPKYSLVHSAWHVLSGLGNFLVLRSTRDCYVLPRDELSNWIPELYIMLIGERSARSVNGLEPLS